MHSGEMIHDQPEPGDDRLSQDQSQEEGPCASIHTGAAIFQDRGLYEPGKEHPEPDGTGHPLEADQESERVHGPPQEALTREHQQPHDGTPGRGGYPSAPTDGDRGEYPGRRIPGAVLGHVHKVQLSEIDPSVGVGRIEHHPERSDHADDHRQHDRPEEPLPVPNHLPAQFQAVRTGGHNEGPDLGVPGVREAHGDQSARAQRGRAQT